MCECFKGALIYPEISHLEKQLLSSEALQESKPEAHLGVSTMFTDLKNSLLWTGSSALTGVLISAGKVQRT